MSWPRLVAATLLSLAAAGCIRPVYGPTASGVSVRDSLAAIEVAPVSTALNQERLGHQLRSELVFALDGSGEPSPKRFKLDLEAAESVQVTTVDVVTGRADAAILNVTVTYALKSSDGTRELTKGTARGTATYYRDQQRFASIRAARDAEVRVAKLVTEDLKQRLAAIFATMP